MGIDNLPNNQNVFLDLTATNVFARNGVQAPAVDATSVAATNLSAVAVSTTSLAFSGKAGETLRIINSTTGKVEARPPLKYGQVAENQTEVDVFLTTGRVAPWSTVFSEWKRFAHPYTFTSTCTYSRTGNLLTIVRSSGQSFSFVGNDEIYIQFTSGGLAAEDGKYKVNISGWTSDQFQTNTLTSGTASGNCIVTWTDAQYWRLITLGSNVVLECFKNSNAHVGFVSNTKHDNYVLEVILTSTNNDDDLITIPVAFYTDSSTNEEFTLSLIRAPKGLWHLYYNFSRAGSSSILLNNSSTVPIYPPNPAPGWAGFPGGVKIKVIRSGDNFTFFTTDFSSTSTPPTSYISGATFTYNLDSDPRTTKFKGPLPYGFGCQSQANSRFNVIAFRDTSPFYDIERNVRYDYNSVTDTWIPTLNRSLAGETDYGTGSFIYDQYTKKTYYVTPTDSINVSRTSTSASGFQFLPAKRNLQGSNPYDISPLVNFSAIDPLRSSNAYISPTDTVSLYNPINPTYPGTTLPTTTIEAFLMKVSVRARLGRQTGTMEFQARRNSTEPWTTLFKVQAGGSAGNWPVSESSTEIIYHDKDTGTFDWRIIDSDTTTTASSPIDYFVDLSLLGIYSS